MRFVNLVNSLVGKTRRGVAQASSLDEETIKSPAKQAEVLRQMMARINKLEAAAVPEATEFEVTLGSGGALTELFHNTKGPVRWWIVCWVQTGGTAYPTAGPQVVQDATSTATSLFLRSYVPGRAVVRVEPSQQYIDNGTTVTNKYGVQQLTAAFSTTAATAQDTGLSISAAAGEIWQVEYWGYSQCSTVNGTAFAIAAPTGATGTGWLDTSSVNSAVANWLYMDLTINTLSAACHAGANNNPRRDSIVYRVKMGTTDGDIKVQFASITAGNTSIISAGACARFTRVLEV